MKTVKSLGSLETVALTEDIFIFLNLMENDMLYPACSTLFLYYW